MQAIQRIHHISAIVGRPQANIDFYRNILGLHLIKQTVNFDDTGVYHLYFSNSDGQPGTVMTFFNWVDAFDGKVGSGQVGRIGFRVPRGSIKEWRKHLESHKIEVKETKSFLNKTLEFEDVHGLDLALVEGAEESSDKKIIGFHGAELLSSNPLKTKKLLVETLGLEAMEESSSHLHFKTAGMEGHQVMILKAPLPNGDWGVGTVHHLAFSVPNDEEHKKWQDKLFDDGYHTTPIKNRYYFHAIYMREPGGVVLEYATDGPGFQIDESKETLGQKLMLPPFYEENREEIVDQLPPIDLS